MTPFVLENPQDVLTSVAASSRYCFHHREKRTALQRKTRQ